jgi:hypothetical protein
MPKFTEGDWEVLEDIIVSRLSNKHNDICGVHRLDDLRLMAQSKKMYEALKELVGDDGHSFFDSSIESDISTGKGIDLKEWSIKVKAILSSIEEE